MAPEDNLRGPSDNILLRLQGGFGMLVLSRTKGQQITIGGSITVTVLEVRGDKVKLGFAGPAETPIHRQEVFERIQNAMRRSIGTWDEHSCAAE
jgi:carbon storage regulator